MSQSYLWVVFWAMHCSMICVAIIVKGCLITKEDNFRLFVRSFISTAHAKIFVPSLLFRKSFCFRLGAMREPVKFLDVKQSFFSGIAYFTLEMDFYKLTLRKMTVLK